MFKVCTLLHVMIQVLLTITRSKFLSVHLLLSSRLHIAEVYYCVTFLTMQQMRPPLPEDTPPELVFIVQSCWVEDPNTRPSFSQIVRMLNAFLYTLPSAPLTETDMPIPVPAVMNTMGTITSTSSSRRGGKLSFLRQLFPAKRASSSST